MGWQISMILIDTTITEQQKIDFVQKYYKSYSKKEAVVLDNVLMPSDKSLYIGEYNNATIITHYEIPYLINYDARSIETFEKKHPLCSKLTKAFPKNNIFCFYFNSVSNLFGYTAFNNEVRTRYKNNFLTTDVDIVKEVGNLLDTEKTYYAHSKIVSCEPGNKVIYDSAKNIFIHNNMLFKREYLINLGTDKEIRSLNEHQCALNIIMDTSKVFLGEKLELLHLEKIMTTKYCK